MNDETKKSDGEQQAAAHMATIAALVAAMNCDFNRLEELRDEKKGLETRIAALKSCLEKSQSEADAAELEEAELELHQWEVDYEEELKELEDEAGELDNVDDVQERIDEYPLDIQVRGDWHSPGETGRETVASEFTILLCTGGPAVRIMGELDDHGQPDRCWLEYQDWFTPWQQYFGDTGDNGILLEFAQRFYFGE